MTVGDIITNRGSSFVPAVGVEIIVLNSFSNDALSSIGVQDGVNTMFNYGGRYNTASYNELLVNKIGLTNTWYYYNTNASGGFTGIQIK